MMKNAENVYRKIASRWPETFRRDDGGMLPYSFTSPSGNSGFKNFFYWDTYFACRGMVLQGFGEQVRKNALNFSALIERFGFIPNAAAPGMTNRSQPPVFGLLAELTAELFPDDVSLHLRLFYALAREVEFWESQRCNKASGLFHYGNSATDEELLEFYPAAVMRLNYPENISDAEKISRASEALCEAESGWDFTPRFERRCPEYAPVDLNALMLANYRILHKFFAADRDSEKAAFYLKKEKDFAEKFAVFYNETKECFMDYDIRNQRHSPVICGAALFPLWLGIATEKEAAATLKTVEKYLELPYGISTCEKGNFGIDYQWAYPNVWPPLQLVAFEAANRYNFTGIAVRWAGKYVDMVTKVFEKNGDLWEKYNGENGSLETVNEYGLPRMMGWSAGTFVCAFDFLRNIGGYRK